MKCRDVGNPFNHSTYCINSDEGIREIYHQCLEENYDYIEHKIWIFTFFQKKDDHCILNPDPESPEIPDNCGIKNNYCSNPKTYHGICEEETRRHYKFAIMLIGNNDEKKILF